MKKAKTIISIITITILVSMILYFCLALIHLRFDCTHDDNCPVCSLIHRFEKELSGYDPNLTKIVMSIMLFYTSFIFFLTNQIFDRKRNTLVGLKVELIN